MKQRYFIWILFIVGLIPLFLPWQTSLGYGEQKILYGYNLIIGANLIGKASQYGLTATIGMLLAIIPIMGGYWIGVLVFLSSLLSRSVRLFKIASWLMLYGVIVTGLFLKVSGGFAGDAQYYSYLEIGYWMALAVTLGSVYLATKNTQYIESAFTKSLGSNQQ